MASNEPIEDSPHHESMREHTRPLSWDADYVDRPLRRKRKPTPKLHRKRHKTLGRIRYSEPAAHIQETDDHDN